MATTTKKALIDRVAAKTEEKRQSVKVIIQGFLDEIIAEVGRGNRLEFRDFGVFEIRLRAPRVAQNPKTLQRVPVPAKRIVKFKMGRKMRVLLDKAGLDKVGAGGVPVRARVRPGAQVEAGPRARSRMGV